VIAAVESGIFSGPAIACPGAEDGLITNSASNHAREDTNRKMDRKNGVT
jgi:hypothetical protein